MIRRTRQRFEIEGDARFLTFSCFGRQACLGEPDAAASFAHELLRARSRLGFRLYAWVVMPDHVHLLLRPRPPEVTVTKILHHTKRPVSILLLNRLRQRYGKVPSDLLDSSNQPRLWQKGGGYDRNIRSREEFIEKLNYIHNNPVRRGLVEMPTDWTWSSARALAGLPTEWPEIDRGL